MNRALNELETTVSRLNRDVQSLRERLNIIMRPSNMEVAQTSSAKVREVQMSRSDGVAQIDLITLNTRDTIDTVQDIMSRLDV